jgi:hypothetical protein
MVSYLSGPLFHSHPLRIIRPDSGIDITIKNLNSSLLDP